MENSTGTIIGLHPLTETSLIVVWCSAEAGIVRTAAKGARRPGSAFAGKLDLFFEAEFSYALSRRGDLHGLREVQLRDPRLGLRESYVRTLSAAYFVRLIELVAEPEHPIPGLHDLLGRGLGYLTRSDPTLRALHHFEAQLAEQSGMGGAASPAQVIRESYGRLPAQRDELLRLLGERP
ncbi:MAG TPA: recombination protein O N-terminal domain-containing protein [Verrucomicrobiales bacterium]|nr:recombination protein O N-terminal domain-containing protein [Verrucomicrobiales bacterium]